jgi:hypothetical protein
MTARDFGEIERLYHAALERPANERRQFLADACGADAVLDDLADVDDVLAIVRS